MCSFEKKKLYVFNVTIQLQLISAIDKYSAHGNSS